MCPFKYSLNLVRVGVWLPWLESSHFTVLQSDEQQCALALATTILMIHNRIFWNVAYSTTHHQKVCNSHW